MNGGAPCFSASGRPAVHSVHSTVHAHITFKHGAKWGGERYRIGSMVVKFGKRQTARLSGWLSSTPTTTTTWICGGCRRRGRRRRSAEWQQRIRLFFCLQLGNSFRFYVAKCLKYPTSAVQSTTSTAEVKKKYLNETTTSCNQKPRHEFLEFAKCVWKFELQRWFYATLYIHIKLLRCL